MWVWESDLVHCTRCGAVLLCQSPRGARRLDGSAGHMTRGGERVVHGGVAKGQRDVQGVMRMLHTGTKYDLRRFEFQFLFKKDCGWTTKF